MTYFRDRNQDAGQRRAYLEAQGRLCDVIAAPPGDHPPSCPTGARRQVTFYDLDDAGKRVGEKQSAQLCTRHRRLMDESLLFEVVTDVELRPKKQAA